MGMGTVEVEMAVAVEEGAGTEGRKERHGQTQREGERGISQSVCCNHQCHASQ